jgi:D-methionine transport system substrate-binding protein
MRLRKVLLLAGMITLAFSLAACSKERSGQIEANTDHNIIKMGTSESSEPILRKAAELMEKKGYRVEISIFDTNTLSVTAANDGSIDGTFSQHIKFVESFNQTNHGDLTMVKPYTYYTGIGLYSEKYDSIEELPDGARVSIMNDAMNMDRGLRMMRDGGIITLGEKEDMGYTLLDISENKKNIEFIDMEQSQTARSLPDVDAAIVFFTHMRNAQKDFNSYILRDTDAADFPMGISVKEKNKDEQWTKDFADCLISDEVKQLVADDFDNVFEFYE